jgi:hypothetical protein
VELNDMVDSIRSKHDLVAFVYALAQDLKSRPEEWENSALGEFLSSFAGWLTDSDGYYRNKGIAVPVEPAWKNIGEMLIAAKYYE